MLYVYIAFSGLFGAFFSYHILSWLLAGRERLKLIIFILLGVGQALGYLIFEDYLGALAAISPYVLVYFIFYRVSIGFNFRKSKFKQKIKREESIISSYHSKRLINYIVLIGIAAIDMTLIVLLIIYQIYLVETLAFIGVSIIIFVVQMLMSKTNKDIVVFCLGTQHKKVYSLELTKYKTLVKEVFIDEMYYVTYCGVSLVKTGKIRYMIHHFMLTNDKINYQLGHLKLNEDQRLLELSGHFTQNKFKKLLVRLSEQTVTIEKEDAK